MSVFCQSATLQTLPGLFRTSFPSATAGVNNVGWSREAILPGKDEGFLINSQVADFLLGQLLLMGLIPAYLIATSPGAHLLSEALIHQADDRDMVVNELPSAGLRSDDWPLTIVDDPFRSNPIRLVEAQRRVFTEGLIVRAVITRLYCEGQVGLVVSLTRLQQSLQQFPFEGN